MSYSVPSKCVCLIESNSLQKHDLNVLIRTNNTSDCRDGQIPSSEENAEPFISLVAMVANVSVRCSRTRSSLDVARLNFKKKSMVKKVSEKRCYSSLYKT